MTALNSKRKRRRDRHKLKTSKDYNFIHVNIKCDSDFSVQDIAKYQEYYREKIERANAKLCLTFIAEVPIKLDF